MKFKFLALALFLLAIHSAEVAAKDVALPKGILLSKEKSGVIFFAAEDTISIIFNGSALPSAALLAYTPITFTQDILSHGKAIRAKSASQFLLQEGTYALSFTGTFQNTSPGDDIPFFMDIGLQVGSHVISVFTDSQENFQNERFVISSVYKVFEVDKPTRVSLVARNTALGTQATLLTRSITIEKL